MMSRNCFCLRSLVPRTGTLVPTMGTTCERCLCSGRLKSSRRSLSGRRAPLPRCHPERGLSLADEGPAFVFAFPGAPSSFYEGRTLSLLLFLGFRSARVTTQESLWVVAEFIPRGAEGA